MSDTNQIDPPDGFDAAFHYPPDLLEQLLDPIPLLCKSKKGVLLFFQGAGVPAEDFTDIREEVEADRTSHN